MNADGSRDASGGGNTAQVNGSISGVLPVTGVRLFRLTVNVRGTPEECFFGTHRDASIAFGVLTEAIGKRLDHVLIMTLSGPAFFIPADICSVRRFDPEVHNECVAWVKYQEEVSSLRAKITAGYSYGVGIAKKIGESVRAPSEVAALPS